MADQLTLQELREKIDWEGGIVEAVEYGLQPDEMPSESLRAAWQTLVDALQEAEKACRAVDRLLCEDPS